MNFNKNVMMTISLLLITVFITGCNPFKKLKGVDDITVVALTHNKEFRNSDSTGDVEKLSVFSPIKSLNQIGNATEKIVEKGIITGLDKGIEAIEKKLGISYAENQKNVQNYYNSIYIGLLEILKKHKLNVKDVNDISDKTILKHIRGQKLGKAGEMDYYSPDGFPPATHVQKKRVMRKIAKEINTDAVVTMKILLVNDKKNIFSDEVGLQVYVNIWKKDKGGVIEFHPPTYYMSRKVSKPVRKAFDKELIIANHIVMNDKTKPAYNELRDAFLRDVDRKLAKAKLN